MTAISVPRFVDNRQAPRWIVAVLGAPVIFGAFAAAKGINPLTMYGDMLLSLADPVQAQTVLVRAAVLLLAGLAVAVPARAGLLNVGGEGQIVIGAVAAAGVGLIADQRLPGGLVLLLMMVAAMAAGAAWAGLAAGLRLTVKVNEAISTLLLNFVAIDIMLGLIYDPWKDASGFGQPSSRPLEETARLPLFVTGGTVNAGIVLALLAMAGVWWALKYTSWGFKLRVVGGNPEAARRAGLRVGPLLLSAMLVGGALAGLAGLVHFAGTEFKLRPGLALNFGYIGFLASWLAMHRPLRIGLAALLLAAIAMGADSLQIDAGLPAASLNVLMAVVLLVVLGSRLARSKS
ncbi:ABC transporter permease [Paractinoplanes rishiriensis]|uniref:ABC transporter permease n=1 Tax=Paractinoplanes rishiriensis TaxID=1050105 RepID=A0A919JZR5_9ACTN|nr:ABC transporter permease [Actinoplanes rishiriensis]GIE97693.1 ABC transporter permease [Actinoplanes rishiriensis]